jgi:hypothetical protein
MTYNILQSVGAFEPGQSVADGDFPAGTDFDRLQRLGAIQPVPGQTPPDPPKVAALKKQLAVSQGMVASLQADLNLANARIAEFEAVAAGAG